ncbi:MAG: recombinase family protein [Albidovulum sp.]
MAVGERLVAYERVSTARQGLSGLGLEAQRKAIGDFASARGAEVLARFTEVESGRKADRPELARALHLAKVTGATLVIARLDRLSRNAAFLLALRDSGVRFLACDMPQANDLTVGVMALVAEAEREAISRRTKEALAAARSRGVRLGNPNGAASLRRAGKGGAALRAAVTANADGFARDLAPVIADIRAGGATSLRAIAAELTARGIRTRRGGRWQVSQRQGPAAAAGGLRARQRGPRKAPVRSTATTHTRREHSCHRCRARHPSPDRPRPSKALQDHPPGRDLSRVRVRALSGPRRRSGCHQG